MPNKFPTNTDMTLTLTICHQIDNNNNTRLTALFWDYPGEPVPEKEKAIWILLKQETVNGSGISWAMCKSASHSRHITMPLSFLQAGCPSCRPTNSIKALKAICHQIEE